MKLIQDINKLYVSEPALYQYPFDSKGFEWVDYGDQDNSVIIFMRKSANPEEALVVVCNFTPQPRHLYRVGVPTRGSWKEVFNSDDPAYGGSGLLNQALIMTSPVKYHGKDYSVSFTLPPLAVSVLKLHEEINEFEIGS
jgi:1,4-alpha-glucan branching enzyme